MEMLQGEKPDTEGQIIMKLNTTVNSTTESVPTRQINWNAPKSIRF